MDMLRLLYVSRITLGPPHKILDETIGGANVASCAFLAHLEGVRPALSVRGHIHKDRGWIIKQWNDDGSERRKSAISVNATTQVNGMKYKPTRRLGLLTGYQSLMRSASAMCQMVNSPIIVNLRT